jgi:predicted membrane channel-forming protein YqfA (hemolysin III family)
VLAWPAEIFHIFVILASATHFVAVAQLVYEFDGGKKIA